MGTIDFSKWVQPDGGGDNNQYPVLDIYGEDTPIDFLFSLNGAGFIARGNVQTVKGREKTGKSAFGIALIVSALKGEFAGIKVSRENLKVLWVDTEQDITTLRQRAKAVLSMAGMDGETPKNLVIVPVRGLQAPDQAAATGAAIERETPDFVFLDGAADLCEDFNGNRESATTVAALMRHTEKNGCALLAVIHTNKKDDEARGHLGTILQQKSSEVYELNRVQDTATVKQTLCRFAGIPDIKFKFVDGFKLQQAVGAVNGTAAKIEKMKHIFGEVCAGRGEWKYKDLVNKYGEIEGVATRAAKYAISEALKNDILFRDEQSGAYTYLFPKQDDEPKQDDDPL